MAKTSAKKHAKRKKRAVPTGGFGVRAYGDPVIVDDGGSTRISGRGKEMADLKNNPPRQELSGYGGARLSVFSATAAGPFATSVMLEPGDVVKIKFSNRASVTVELDGTDLVISGTHKATEHAIGDGHGYHVAGPQYITSVTHEREETVDLLNAVQVPTATFVCVEHPTP